jgi:hypothetical protein
MDEIAHAHHGSSMAMGRNGEAASRVGFSARHHSTYDLTRRTCAETSPGGTSRSGTDADHHH